jgi:hypothetical protein
LSTSGASMKNWIFQANPERYDVLADLRAGPITGGWSIARHQDELAAGEPAGLWVSGRHAGIYALGRIAPGAQFEAPAGEGWLHPEDRDTTMRFQPIEFDELLLDNPITKDELRSDARFATARIISQPFAANPFLTTNEEWKAIEELREHR